MPAGVQIVLSGLGFEPVLNFGPGAGSSQEAEPGLELDYLELVDGDSFEPVTEVAGERTLVVAARVGSIRLLDNVILAG